MQLDFSILQILASISLILKSNSLLEEFSKS